MSLEIEASKTVKLALPLIFGELTQILLDLIDTAMIGSVGPNSYLQVAAAALALSVVSIPFMLSIGLTMAVAQLTSMAKGKDNEPAIAHYLYNSIFLCGIVAVLFALIVELSTGVLGHLGQDPEIVVMAKPYMRISGLSLIPMVLFLTLKQFSDGLEFTKTAMTLSLIALPFNMFVNWLLIFGNWGFPRLEMMGAAYGTLITRSLMFVVLGVVILRHSVFKPYLRHRASHWKLRKRTWRELVRIGFPSGLQAGMEGGVFAVSTIIIGTFGAEQLAAHRIALQCATFTYMVSMGFGQASSIRVSNAFGRKDWKTIGVQGRANLLVALAYGVFCALFFLLLRNYLPLIFLDDTFAGGNAAAVAVASTLLMYAGFFQIFDATQVVSSGILRGIQDVKMPTIFIFLAYWVLGLPVGYWLATSLNMGAAGIWLGLIIGLAFVSIALSHRFFRRIDLG